MARSSAPAPLRVVSNTVGRSTEGCAAADGADAESATPGAAQVPAMMPATRVPRPKASPSPPGAWMGRKQAASNSQSRDAVPGEHRRDRFP